MSLFVKIATQVQTDARIMQAGPEAAFCWIRGLLYAKDHLTNGFVPQVMLPLITIGAADPQTAVRRLLDAGLWVEAEGGYTVGEERWARHQTTSEQVEESREKNRERQAAYRQRQRDTRGDDKGEAPSRSSATEGASQPEEGDAGEPLAESASLFSGQQGNEDAPEASWEPLGAGNVTGALRDRNAVTGQPEYRAQSTEHRVKNYTHSAREPDTPPSREPLEAGSVAMLDGLAREIVHAYPASRAVGMDPLELPPDQVALVQGAILRESRKAGCDPELAAAQLLVWTQEFSAIVAEWPPGEVSFLPGIRKFFNEYQYRNLERFRRGADRNGKGHGRAAGPSAAERRVDSNRAKLAGAFRGRRGTDGNGGAGSPDDGELLRPDPGRRPGRVVDAAVVGDRRAA